MITRGMIKMISGGCEAHRTKLEWLAFRAPLVRGHAIADPALIAMTSFVPSHVGSTIASLICTSSSFPPPIERVEMKFRVRWFM